MLGQTLDGKPQKQSMTCRGVQDWFTRVEESLVPRARHLKTPMLGYGCTHQGRDPQNHGTLKLGQPANPKCPPSNQTTKNPVAVCEEARNEISTKESEVNSNEG